MPGMNLAQLQATLRDYVLDRGGDPRAALPLLADGYGPTPERRLQVYHHAYRARLQEALGAVFERTWAYLGDQEFSQLTDRYVESHPSRSRNLGDYGDRFPAHLAAELAADPEAAELAWMDWNLHLAFAAPNQRILTSADLGHLGEADWESAAFIFQPGMRVAVFAWNVVDIWHALDQGLIPPPARRLERPTAHVFWRCGTRTQFRSLTGPEHTMLSALLHGAAFARSCETLAEECPEVVTMAGVWLQRWIADEMIAGVVV